MPPRTTERDYWPCLPIVEDGTLRSIIFTKFELLSRTHPRATSGYAVEALVKKLAPPALKKRVKFDPEADMFAAYGDDAAALLAVAKLVRTATGMKPPKAGAVKAAMSAEEARTALRRGYIEGLDAKAQQAFLKGWPRPADSNHDRLLKDMRAKDAKVRLAATRQILRAACRVVGRLEDPLCHPTTFDVVMAAIAAEKDPKIYDELVATLAMLCRRAMPDGRAAAVLAPLLDHPRARARQAAIQGVGFLASIPWNLILALLEDERADMRESALDIVTGTGDPMTPWITGDVVIKRAPFPRKQLPRIAKLLDDENMRVRVAASHALRALGAKAMASELARRAKREKLALARDAFAYNAEQLRNA